MPKRTSTYKLYLPSDVTHNIAIWIPTSKSHQIHKLNDIDTQLLAVFGVVEVQYSQIKISNVHSLLNFQLNNNVSRPGSANSCY